MGQAHSFVDTEHATITPAVGVPMLDWPSDLFSDSADLTDLDLLPQCDPAFLPHPHSREGQDFCIQLAA